MKRSIQVGILTPSDMRSRNCGYDFIRLLASFAGDYLPEYYNNFEPIDLKFDLSRIDEVLEVWGWNFLWRKDGQQVSGSVWANNNTHSTIYLDLTPKSFDNEQVIALITAVSENFTVDLAYIHMHVESDIENVEIYKVHKMPFVQGLTTHHLRHGLPDLCWGMYFGKPYRSIFGRKLQTAPSHIVEDDGSGVYIQLTESIDDVRDSRETYLSTQIAVKEHLNSSAFMSTGNEERCLVPVFDLGRPSYQHG